MQKETTKNVSVAKALNEELQQVTYVAMKPGVDLHGDMVDLETIRLAKESFNRQLRKANLANLYHISKTNDFDIIESYLAPTDMTLNGNFVQKGEWLVTLSVTNNELWGMIKSDEITGVSIGAMCNIEEI